LFITLFRTCTSRLEQYNSREGRREWFKILGCPEGKRRCGRAGARFPSVFLLFYLTFLKIEIEENPEEQSKNSSKSNEDSDSDESQASSPSAVVSADLPAASAAASRGAASAPAAVRADDIARDMGLHLQTMQKQMALLQQKLDSLVAAAKKV
jgi:hypothetical protein